MLAKGIRKQVLGGVLFCLGAMTVLLSRAMGFELDVFYIVIMIIGMCLFLYGVMQTKKQILTNEPQCFGGFSTGQDAIDGVQSPGTDNAVCNHLASHSASMRQSVSVHGN